MYTLKIGQCGNCGFTGEQKRFRLMTVGTERVDPKTGSIKRDRWFDGTYRCPLCGSTGIGHSTREVLEHEDAPTGRVLER